MDGELQELLSELVENVGARSAYIEPDGVAELADGTHASPLGRGARLVVEFAEPLQDDPDRAASIERAVRALRACARRWDADSFPTVYARARPRGPEKDRVIDRIRAYLVALANAQGVTNVTVTVRDEVIASAIDLDELQRARIPFLLKQVEAEVLAHKGVTSHIEIVREDLCAFAFWVDACLVAFCEGDFSADFLRHRARMVTREIGQLLPHLDEPPPTPVNVSPLPE